MRQIGPQRMRVRWFHKIGTKPIAVAGLLGFKLMRNFDAPYLATSIIDFWRKWHISLSTWLRDYLYISLGGNRHGTIKRYRNLMLTMLLGGLWHGAAWTFVVWGILHGLALCINHLWHAVKAPRLPNFIGWAITFYLVSIAWIFFRAPDFATAFIMAQSYMMIGTAGTQSLDVFYACILIALFTAHFIWQKTNIETRIEALSPAKFAVVLGAITPIILLLHPVGYRPFIYFQF